MRDHLIFMLSVMRDTLEYSRIAEYDDQLFALAETGDEIAQDFYMNLKTYIPHELAS